MKDADKTIELHTGRKMPVMGLGTWQLTDQTQQKVETAISNGYRLIDTSSDYGTQAGIGDAVKACGLDRDQLYLQTKVEEDDDAFVACQEYIKEMKLEYADLLIIHRPPKTGVGEELWRGLIKSRDMGHTKDIGVSNYSVDQLKELIELTGEVPTVNQIEWSPFGHSKEMLEYCREQKIIIQAFSPLTRAKRLDNVILADIAFAHNKSPAQIIIKWDLQQGVVPIPKASDPDHIEENIDVFDFELSDEEMVRLNNLNEKYSALAGLQY